MRGQNSRRAVQHLHPLFKSCGQTEEARDEGGRGGGGSLGAPRPSRRRSRLRRVCEPRVQSHAAVQYTVGKRGMLFAEARPKEEG